MKEITIDEFKKCSIGILDFIDSVCHEHNLTYYLSGGTLLGAFRHNGFIPWDDDIDIMMPRNDYEKLFQVWPKGFHYKFLNYKNTANFPYAYGKVIDDRTIKIEPMRSISQVIGVDVDVFPIDGLPKDDKETVDYYKMIDKVQARLYLQLSSFGKGRTLFHTVARNARLLFLRFSELVGITSIYKITRRFDRLAQKYSDADTGYCGVTAISHYGVKEKNPCSNYSETVNVIFEGKGYPAPVGYADYLSRLYGKNYMQLPPLEMRKSHHEYVAYWK